MRIVSGPAKGEPLWQLLRAALFLGFALYFVYDGAIGYPAAVVSKAKAELAKPEPFGGKLSYESLPEHPTKEDYERLPTAPARPGEAPPVWSREQVESTLGKPAVVNPAGGTRTTEYFVSKWGYVALTFDGTRAAPAQWVSWYKTRGEIQQQYYWALIPALPGLYFLWKLIKAVTLRVTLDDSGLDYGGRKIGWDAMTGLRGYSHKGWIDLYFTEGGAEKRLRFDNEKFKLFEEIVAAICERKGFINEIEVYKAELARRQADEEAARAAEEQAEAEDEGGESRPS